MATLDLSQSMQAFFTADRGTADFNGFEASALSIWRWTTSGGHFIDVVDAGTAF